VGVGCGSEKEDVADPRRGATMLAEKVIRRTEMKKEKHR
jgi:hypothetical protein